MAKAIKVRYKVLFEDEFGKQRIGEVTRIVPAGECDILPGVVIRGSYGGYMRSVREINKLVKTNTKEKK
jgi:hypothetical protein